jgi:tRNA(Ile)-lysidine synthase
MQAVLEQGGEWPGAVAVSGGADSLALLLLLADWAAGRGLSPPVALTVDHGLQLQSGRQAENVARRVARRGLSAHVLRWRGRKPVADIESAAREARYRLMGDWCRKNGVRCLYVAHSLDDQAETFLLRLVRGSGVDGLAAMADVAPFPSPNSESLRVVRPLLSMSRAKLRAFLSGSGESWLEDPMNSDMRFARVRLRAAWPALRDLGFTAERIAAAARHLGRARAALDADTVALLAHASRMQSAFMLLDAKAICGAPEEIGLRALASALTQVSGQHYRPRFERLERLLGAIRAGTLGRGKTLHGCCIGEAPSRDAIFGSQTLRIVRETGRRSAARGNRDGIDRNDGVKLTNSS